jgi:fatty acid-binding protein DegV
MTVTVVTDSAAAVPDDLVTRYAISVVPMWIHLGDTTIAEGARPLGELLGDPRVTTSAPHLATTSPRFAAASTAAPTTWSCSRSRLR